MVNTQKIVTIIQARMGSTRLPGKILLKLGAKSVLEHVVSRVQQCSLVDEVIVATTTLAGDDATVAECLKIAAKYYRGSSDNVLERYYLAAKEAEADIVVRITSDCPFIDPKLLHAMLEKFQNEKADYLSNTIQRCYPRGFDIEIFTFRTLEQAYNNATSPHEKEHVTPYIYLNPENFTISQYTAPENNSDLRVTLDTNEDWQLICNVYNTLAKENPHFGYAEVIDYLRKNPEVIAINAHVEQKKL